MPEIPQGLCSKCHEGFMNCKCEQFHPIVPSLSESIIVTCHCGNEMFIMIGNDDEVLYGCFNNRCNQGLPQINITRK